MKTLARSVGMLTAAVLLSAANAVAQVPPQTTAAPKPPAVAPAGSEAATTPPAAPATPAAPTTAPATTPPIQPKPAGIAVPSDYVLGPDDLIGVLFWREPEMSGDVGVRPDGMISLPLVGDIKAAGLAPDELKKEIEKASAKFITDPSVTILVKQINSRKVFITGEVTNPGSYPIANPRTVMQLIALAGGLKEYADSKHITVMRTENGRQRIYKFNYKDVAKGKALAQNIQLQPGDTVVVP